MERCLHSPSLKKIWIAWLWFNSAMIFSFGFFSTFMRKYLAHMNRRTSVFIDCNNDLEELVIRRRKERWKAHQTPLTWRGEARPLECSGAAFIGVALDVCAAQTIAAVRFHFIDIALLLDFHLTNARVFLILCQSGPAGIVDRLSALYVLADRAVQYPLRNIDKIVEGGNVVIIGFHGCRKDEQGYCSCTKQHRKRGKVIRQLPREGNTHPNNIG